MSSALKSLGSGFMAVLLVAGLAAMAYARWTRPVAEADTALASGDYPAALAGYGVQEARFDRVAPAKQFLTSEYNRVVANELWLLHRLQRYDETIDKAGRAPEGANPHFWAGCAFYEKARAEKNPEARLGWLSRAEEEFRRAVEAAPDDWDTKFDFELTGRLAAELRKQPKNPPNQLMQLLRPQPKMGPKPPKRVG
jgi:tetratricopeptide (TPR) repeat protein